MNKIITGNILSDLSSSSISDLSQDLLVEINESNVHVNKNDFICGVIDRNGQQCFRRISCGIHKLQDKYEVERTEDLLDLLLKEAKFSRFFLQQRRFIVNYFGSCYKSNLVCEEEDKSKLVLLMYDLFEEENRDLKQLQDNIVLGTNIPFQNIDESRKRRRIGRSRDTSRSIIQLATDSGTNYYSFTNSSSSKPNNSPTSIGTNSRSESSSLTNSKESTNTSKTNESILNSASSGKKWSSGSTSKSTTSRSSTSKSSTTKSSTSKSTSDSNKKEQNKRYKYLKQLSRETSSKIKEAVAYLHYKLKEFDQRELLQQFTELDSIFKEWESQD